MKSKVIVVLGPTATGKSDLAVMLAKKYNGEVISADSRQVYRGLNLGTGKITHREMRGVSHHLLDVADPKKQFSVANYRTFAKKALSEIASRGKVPIVCGGTGFYIDALVQDTKLPSVPPDPTLRKNLEGRRAAELYTMLTFLDPKRARTIDAQNPRRLIRAIEIAKHAGAVPPLSKQASPYDVLRIGLTLPTDQLREKIHARLLARMKGGMMREVQRLHARGLSWKKMDEFGLEYRYISRTARGILSRDDMLTKLQTEICRYAKRQMTWFKRDENTKWFDPSQKDAIMKVAAEFLHTPAE